MFEKFKDGFVKVYQCLHCKKRTLEESDNLGRVIRRNKMIIDENKVGGKWYEFDEETKFYILQFDFSNYHHDVEVSDTWKTIFMYCLTDWEGLVNKENKPFEYTEKNKEYLYSYYEDIRVFVFERGISLSKNKQED